MVVGLEREERNGSKLLGPLKECEDGGKTDAENSDGSFGHEPTENGNNLIYSWSAKMM
jgi:hypothetical protein